MPLQGIAVPGRKHTRHMNALDGELCMDFANAHDPHRGRLWVTKFRELAMQLGYFNSCRAVCRCPQYPHGAECGLVICHDDEESLWTYDLDLVAAHGYDVYPPYRKPTLTDVCDLICLHHHVKQEVFGMPAPIPDDVPEYLPGAVVDSDPDITNQN